MTVQDKGGATDHIDIALRYSINPNSVIWQDVRSAVRTEPNQFTTLQLLTKRSAVETAIQDQIEKHWAESGVTIDSVSMQDVRPPTSVVASYASAQQAQAQAKANDLLSASLSPQILQAKYLDALKAGTVYVVPSGSTPLIQTK